MVRKTELGVPAGSSSSSATERIKSLLGTIRAQRSQVSESSVYSPLAQSLIAARARGAVPAELPVDKASVSASYAETITRGEQGADDVLSIILDSPAPVYAIGRSKSKIRTSFAGKTPVEKQATAAKKALNFAFAVLVEYESAGKKLYFLQETATQLTDPLDPSKPIEASGGTVLGSGYAVRVTLLGPRRSNPFQYMDWSEFVTGVRPPAQLGAVEYKINTAQPYGPTWGATRPPGTPASLRAVGVIFKPGPVDLPAYVMPINGSVPRALLLGGLRSGDVPRDYDNRPQDGAGGPGLADPGPFGDARGRGITSPSRPQGVARIDRYGVFLWSAAEWTLFSQGFSLPYYTAQNAIAQLEMAAASPIQITYAHEVPHTVEMRATTCAGLLSAYLGATGIEPVFREIVTGLFTTSFEVFRRTLGALSLTDAVSSAQERDTKYKMRNAALHALLVGRALDLSAESGADPTHVMNPSGSYIYASVWSPGATPATPEKLSYGAASDNAPAGNKVIGDRHSGSWYDFEEDGVAYSNGWAQGVHVFPSGQVGSRRGTPIGLIVLHWGGETRAAVIRNLGDTKSTHYTVAADGSVHQHAYLSDATWHAGTQNDWSIGIDLCTTGIIPRGQERDRRHANFTPIPAPVLGSAKYALAPVAMYEATHLLIEKLRGLYGISDNLLGLVRDLADGHEYIVMQGGYYLDETQASKWYGVATHMMLALDDRDKPSRVDEIFMFIYHCARRRGNTRDQAYQNAQRTLAQRVLPLDGPLPPRVKLLLT